MVASYFLKNKALSSIFGHNPTILSRQGVLDFGANV